MEIQITTDKAGDSRMKIKSLGVDFYTPVSVSIAVKISYTLYKHGTGYGDYEL